MQSLERKDSGGLSGECSVKGMKWGLWSVQCRVQTAELGV